MKYWTLTKILQSRVLWSPVVAGPLSSLHFLLCSAQPSLVTHPYCHGLSPVAPFSHCTVHSTLCV